jgi:hypothetical protein
MLSNEPAYITWTVPPALAVGVAETEVDGVEEPQALINKANKDAIDISTMVRESGLCGELCVCFTGCSFAKYSLYEYSIPETAFSTPRWLGLSRLLESQTGGRALSTSTLSALNIEDGWFLFVLERSIKEEHDDSTRFFLCGGQVKNQDGRNVACIQRELQRQNIYAIEL